jgi:Asp-tRNA(Asn)/Glu-tRNA(Gln) amidotransferase A subunit family amidase
LVTFADAARLIERRQLSPVELTDALIARAEVLDPQLNAFMSACRLPRRLMLNPLTGAAL